MGSKGRQHRQAISITEVRVVWWWRTSCIQDQSSSGSRVLLWATLQTGLASSARRAERTGLCAGGWAIERGKIVVRSQQAPFLAGFPQRHKYFFPHWYNSGHFQQVQVLRTQRTFLCETEWDVKNNSNHDPCISGVFITHPECHRPQELGDRPRALKHAIEKMSTTQSIISNVCLMCGAAESSEQETVE